MMTYDITLSSKGQFTVPKAMREELGLKPGDIMVYSEVNGEIVMTPKSLSFEDVAGLLGDPPKGRATIEEINAGIGHAASAAAGRDDADDGSEETASKAA